MSKMPSKKKSCFQITSVTQAQVTANSNTDDTESLDDPESRTEDMSSSEIYDISKSGDFEPETCDVSLSDEPLNNESETSGTSISIVQDGLTSIPGSRYPGAVHINPNVRGAPSQMSTAPSHHSSSVTSSVVSNAPSCMAQTCTSVSSSATVSSCSSRFRVIKLDHSTGEPFKRGRWTCAEFYEKDTDGTTSGRTADNVKHTSTLEHNADRDGLGITGGLVSTPVAPSTLTEPHNDSGYASAPSNPPVEFQQQSNGYSQQGSGLVSHSLYTGGAHIQHVKSPSMPSTTQPQPIYQGQQAQNPGQMLPTVIPTNQPDFRSQHPLEAPGSSLISPPLGAPLNQGPSPVMAPAVGGTHVLGLIPQSVDAMGHGRAMPEHVQGLLQQPGIGAALGTVSATAVVPQPLVQPAVTVSVTPHTVVPGVQNVPVVMSSASNTTHNMPNHTPVPVLQNQPQGIPSGLVVGLGTQTTPFSFSQLPTGIILAEHTRRKSDALPQSSVILGKDVTRSLNADGLQLSTPAVNSLFGISIPIDGDEDRNPSTAFYQAFPNCRSKTISNGASGASVVAIDNKIEQAMDLVKSHLMYAVREEVEVLKEQIKELYERNSMLERENAVLKSLANTEQLSQLSGQPNNPGSTSPQQTPVNAILQDGSILVALPPQPNVSTA
nr:TSC22 domain family protein 2 isoform X1 [Misgurnus anguillicaudatus]